MPRELGVHRCIRWRWPGRSHPEPWEFWNEDRWSEIAVDGPLIVDDRELEIEAALSGTGLARTVADRVMPMVADGGLRSVLEPWAGTSPGYLLCYPRAQKVAPAVQAFLDNCLENSAGQLPLA